MTSYHDLEDSTYTWIRAQPFTRIHGKPTWDQVERLHKEAADVTMDCDVSYTWLLGHGLLAQIMGPVISARTMCMTRWNLWQHPLPLRVAVPLDPLLVFHVFS